MSGIRIAYCTNVAPAGSVDALVGSLGTLWAEVRRRAMPDGRLGLGLWFEEGLAAELAGDGSARARVARALKEGALDLVTVNAFPQRAFHAPRVKEDVYRPRWGEPARIAYTLDAARAAAGIAGPGADLTLSTLPVGFPKLDAAALRRGADHLAIAALKLADLARETGTRLRLAVEPEPAAALETTDETIRFFEEHLRPVSGNRWEEVRAVVGVCLDLCHAAVEHEDPVEALGRYRAAGIAVPKVQVSAAVHVPDAAARAMLAAFVEPRWLHQVGVGPGRVVADLPDALAHPGALGDCPWRVHFHVPLDAAEVGGLPTTRGEVERFLAHVVRGAEDVPVLELETYTWSVVPGAGSDLAAAVAREIAWVRGRLETA